MQELLHRATWAATSETQATAARSDAAQDDDRVRTQPGRVGQRRRLVDAAPARDGLEVAEVGPAAPCRGALLDEAVDAEGGEPLGLRRVVAHLEADPTGRGEEELRRDVAGDVALARRDERVAAGIVATVRAQPGAPVPSEQGRGVREVVDDHDL